MHVTGEEGDKWEEKVAVVRQHGKRGERREGRRGREGGWANVGFSETHLQFKTRFGIMKM